jgi:hypothetical protein
MSDLEPSIPDDTLDFNAVTDSSDSSTPHPLGPNQVAGLCETEVMQVLMQVYMQTGFSVARLLGISNEQISSTISQQLIESRAASEYLSGRKDQKWFREQILEALGGKMFPSPSCATRRIA